MPYSEAYIYTSTSCLTCLVLEDEVRGPVAASVGRVPIPVLPARIQLQHRQPFAVTDATAGAARRIAIVHDHNRGAKLDDNANDSARRVRSVGLGASGVQDEGCGRADLDGPVEAQAFWLPGFREGYVDRRCRVPLFFMGFVLFFEGGGGVYRLERRESGSTLLLSDQGEPCGRLRSRWFIVGVVGRGGRLYV